MRVIFIDPDIVTRSPAMKFILASLPYLKERGFDIELWCTQTDCVLEGVKVRKLPSIPLPPPLSYWVFFIVCNIYSILYALRTKECSIKCTTGFYCINVDIAFIHFSSFNWVKQLPKAPPRNWKDVIRTILSLQGLLSDLTIIYNPFSPRLIAVSEGVAGDFRKFPTCKNRLSVLPNPYDSEKYNVHIRDEWRQSMRATLKFNTNDTVFVFASTGHYQRKGFWLAIGALSKLRQRDGLTSIKFLVIGGTETRLKELQSLIELEYPDWREWITFTGMVTSIYRYLSAGDALLFPSYSEAFALVEIEASALGLRLYLTPHHGSESILKEGVNGRYLQWNEEAIVAVLREEIYKNLARPGLSFIGTSLDFPAYVDALTSILNEVRTYKSTKTATMNR